MANEYKYQEYWVLFHPATCWWSGVVWQYWLLTTSWVSFWEV